MPFLRFCYIVIILLAGVLKIQAQTIYYPAGSSELLKSTATDMAMLLQRAVSGSRFTTESYDVIPGKGIVFVYDSVISDNQACRVQTTGDTLILFSASQDNGLHYGIYQYLQQLGFRFYQPGAIWEITPTLFSPYKKTDTIYTCRFVYKTWFITGGHNRWVMDNSNDDPWDTWFGENGHQWALYQRRNGMTGSHRFTGHRDDIMTENYLASLQNNPCYIACYDGKRTVTTQSVPDVNNPAAMQLWSNSIGQKYTQYKSTIFGNKPVYANFYRNFNYNQEYIGLEVPDGAHWANSTDHAGCNGTEYKKESDQHFTLANYTAEKLNSTYPGKRFQVYAYDGHADIPGIDINKNIDVQVVATAFQSESSTNGLLNRWYNKTNHISEYQYLNLTQWGGETPSFYLKDLINTVKRLKEKNSQGITWEASPAKFASLPFLLAANRELADNISIDSSLHEFCNSMFAGAANAIYNLLQLWSSDKVVTIGDWMNDNKYKMPLYLDLLKTADGQIKNAPPVVKRRIRELKAYLHYMILYYDWSFDQRGLLQKEMKAGALCTYLAKINKLQLVNSYFLITVITNGYSTTGDMYTKYNVNNGTAYQNGSLPLITASEIENNFITDLGNLSGLVQQYKFEEATGVRMKLNDSKMIPLEKISVRILFTSGKDYTNRSEFFIDAPSAGNFSIRYTPQFNMPGKGYVNFTVEATGQAIQIIKDFSIDNTSSPGTLNVALPAAGTYKLSIVSKYKSSVDLLINTNGNYFYKSGGWLGTTEENYRANLLSLPGYFYVPAGMSKIYFSISNSNPAGMGFASPAEISKAFLFRDNNGNSVQPHLVNTTDSALFCLDIPAGSANNFWQVFKMEQYRLSFVNISNLQWYARREPCSDASFTTTVVPISGECITRLKNTSNSSVTQWYLYDAGISYQYKNQETVDLPANFSSNAIITLTIDGKCTITRRIGDNPSYLTDKDKCASGTPIQAEASKSTIFPNPGNGIFYCAQNGSNVLAKEITVFNTMGAVTGRFKNTSQFDISHLPAGIYVYQVIIGNEPSRGRLIKL